MFMDRLVNYAYRSPGHLSLVCDNAMFGAESYPVFTLAAPDVR